MAAGAKPLFSHYRYGTARTHMADRTNSRGVVVKERLATSTFVRIADTTLYKPGQATHDEAMVFLLWDTAGPPATIPAGQTWSDSGPPAKTGYYVFLNALPPDASAAAFESELRGFLAVPVATGFVWGQYRAPAKAVVQTVIPVKINAANHPV